MFGIQLFDIKMMQVLIRNGLTVAQACEQRKTGTLPMHVEEAWKEYEAALAEYRGNHLQNISD